MKIKPLHNLVAIKPDQDKGETESGLILPVKAMTKAQTGTVIASGPGYYNSLSELVPTGVKEGDRVMFHPDDGDYHEFEGEKFLLIASANIVGVLT